MAAVETKKDEVVDRFETYEDYLDTFITEDDMICSMIATRVVVAFTFFLRLCAAHFVAFV